MMGSVGSWFYKYILGITPDAEHPAFERFNIRPVVFDDLSFAEGELLTVKGAIKSAWKKEGNKLNLDITIPANSTAKVYVPAVNIKTVTESGKSVAKSKEMKVLEEGTGYVLLEVGSGTYNFRSAIKQ
jgi:alpha-L-rhamnosidase